MPDFQYSKEVDSATIEGTPSFTTLPIRVHRDDLRARKASRRFRTTWEAAGGSRSSSPLMPGGEAPVGHIMSLTLPECCPDRLEVVTKMADYMCLENGQYAPVLF